MNTDIRISVSFKGHRKRKRLALVLGPGSTDCLLDLWISAAMCHPDGLLGGMDATDIALDAGWTGDPDAFVKALVDCGFLDPVDGEYRLHDWEEHQAYVVHGPDRTARARHAAMVRHSRRENAASMPDACSPHARRMPPVCSDCAPSPAPSPIPAPIALDAPSCPHGGNSEHAEDSPVVRIPLVDGTEFCITQADLALWAESFPAVDVLAELKRVRLWALDNPSRRKTSRGIRRHVSLWLGRVQDRGGGPPSGTQGPRPQPAQPIYRELAE